MVTRETTRRRIQKITTNTVPILAYFCLTGSMSKLNLLQPPRDEDVLRDVGTASGA